MIILKYIHIVILLIILNNYYNFINSYSYTVKNFCIINEMTLSINNKSILWDDLYFNNIFILSNPIYLLINLNIENIIKINNNVKIVKNLYYFEKSFWQKYKKIYLSNEIRFLAIKIINIILLNKYKFSNKINEILKKYNIYIYHKIKFKNINIKLNKVNIFLLHINKVNKYYNFYCSNIKLSKHIKNFIYYKKNILIGPLQYAKGKQYLFIDNEYFKYKLLNNKRILYKNIINYINIKKLYLPIFFFNLASVYSYYCYL